MNFYQLFILILQNGVKFLVYFLINWSKIKLHKPKAWFIIIWKALLWKLMIKHIILISNSNKIHVNNALSIVKLWNFFGWCTSSSENSKNKGSVELLSKILAESFKFLGWSNEIQPRKYERNIVGSNSSIDNMLKRKSG